MADIQLSLREIREALARLADPWTAGPTSLSYLPPDEQCARLGLTPPPEARTAEAIEASAGTSPDLALGAYDGPAVFDLRDVAGRGFVSPIKDQADCAAGVAFAVAAAMECQMRRDAGDPDLGVEVSASQIFLGHGRARGRDCRTGWWPTEALEDMRRIGVLPARHRFREGGEERLPDESEERLRITGQEDLTGRPVAIKDWLRTKGPVVACLLVHEDFFSLCGGVYRPVAGRAVGGHCVAIIGYDDRAGCWICQNSWGTDWGEGGFFRIGYGQCGIDSWLVAGILGVSYTGWQRARRVRGLWASGEARSAWVYFEALGWRRVCADNDAVFVAALGQLISAKTAGHPVRFFDRAGVVTQVCQDRDTSGLGWQANRRVSALWANGQIHNAWAHLGGVGWRRVRATTDSAFLAMLAQLIAAKGAGRPVNAYVDDHTITQVYVY